MFKRHRWEHHESLFLLEFMNQCFFFHLFFRVRIDCMVNSAAVSYRFQAIASIPTFNSRHRATCTSCRIFRSLAQLPCHGRPRCCSRSDILVLLLRVRSSVVLNKALFLFLIVGIGSHRSCFIPHFVIFGSEYPRAWWYRRRWRRWWLRTAPRYQISDWLRSGDDSFIVITFLLSSRYGFRSILRTELRAPLRAEKANFAHTENGSIQWNVPWSACLRVGPIFDGHLDHSFIVFIDVQHSSCVRRIHDLRKQNQQ